MYHAAFAVLLSAAVPSAVPESYGPAGAVVMAARDLAGIPEHDRIHQRYLWHPGPRAAIAEFDPVIRLWVNSLSRISPLAQPARPQWDLWRIDLRLFDFDPNTYEKFRDLDPYFHVQLKVAPSVAVEPEPEPEYVWRHNEKAPTQYGLFRHGKQIGAYDSRFGYRRWNATTKKWSKPTEPPITFPGEQAVKAPNPSPKPALVAKPKVITAHAPWLPTKEIAYLAQQTQSQVPIVRADWWYVNVSRQIDLRNRDDTGVGYYDWLRIKDRQTYFDLFKFRIDDSRDLRLDQLAAVAKSGVARNNRQIERNKAITGGVWFTRDVKDETGAGNAVRNLDRRDMKADAQEWYAPLSNGLMVYLLSDDVNGIRQSSAPDFIGPDTTSLSNDGRIHVGLSCLSCHAGDVLKPIDDWARSHYRVGRLALLVPAGHKDRGKDQQFDLFESLKRQYLTDLQFNLESDRLAYRQAIIAACGVDAATIARLSLREFHRYATTLVTPEQAARELGVTVEQLRTALSRTVVGKGSLDPEVAGLLLAPAAPLTRLHFEENYPVFQKALAGDLSDNSP